MAGKPATVGGKNSTLVREGIGEVLHGCVIMAGSTKHSDLFNVLGMVFMCRPTHLTAVGRAPHHPFKENFTLSLWGIN